MRQCPDLMQAWLEYMQHSEAPSQYIKWSLVSAVAACLERKVWLVKDHDTGWYPNMYMFLVGPPGSGKSTVSDTAMAFVRAVKTINFIPTRVNAASIFEELARIGVDKKFNWDNESYPHCAGILYASEAKEAFTEMYKGGGIIGALTDLYNGGSFGWNMVHGEVRSLRSTGRSVVLNPCINLLACSVPDWLFTYCMNRVEAAGGFGSRILLVTSHTSLKMKPQWESAEIIRDMQLRIKIIEDMKRIHNVLRGPYFAHASFKEAYGECIKQYEKENSVRYNSGSGSMLGGYQQRKITHTLKLSMILAACRRDDMLLKGEDIRDAWDMLAEIEPAMINVLGDLEMTPEAKLRRDIWNYLKHTSSNGTATRQSVMNTYYNFDVRSVDNALAGLVAMGRLVPQPTQNSNRITYQLVDVREV